MPIFIYNSLTRKKEEFSPLRPPKVNIYTCGVTVYDESHIGHARSLYIFDLIRRALSYRFEVHFVRNITDVDDKIINRANELRVPYEELVKKYISRYYEDLKALGIAPGDFEPRATENIPDMVRFIERLIKKDLAYESSGDVYFKVRAFPEYGKLSGQSIEEMEVGARIEPTEAKKDPLDFALWKKSKENEPSWMSPWGRGRPGWHIECSVMSQKFLKTDTLDIHAGGRDLIFPHHENEIAQAQGLTGKPFAKYWIHHGLLTINGQKMAKSLGNFVTIKDFLDKYKDPDLLKFFFLTAHYSSPIDYSDERIEEAHQALGRIRILMEKIDKKAKRRFTLFERGIKEIDNITKRFSNAIEDDFNTPQALAALFDLVNAANKNIEDRTFRRQAKRGLEAMLTVFGISLKARQASGGLLEDEINKKITERENARKNKDFILADKIRKQLEEEGVILEDAKEGTAWRRK